MAAYSSTAEGPSGFYLLENAIDRDELAVVSRWFSSLSVASQINAPRFLRFGAGCPFGIPDELSVLLSTARNYANVAFRGIVKDIEFNHVTVQRHQPGQGVPPNRDRAESCGPVTAVFTFDGVAVYEFRPPEEEALRQQTTDTQYYAVKVLPQSLFLLGPTDARYLYTHQVSRHCTARVTVTLRSVPPPRP